MESGLGIASLGTCRGWGGVRPVRGGRIWLQGVTCVWEVRGLWALTWGQVQLWRHSRQILTERNGETCLEDVHVQEGGSVYGEGHGSSQVSKWTAGEIRLGLRR